MESLYILIPLSVVLVFVIAAIFWWSLKSGQFDDLEGPGYRILMDDDRLREKTYDEYDKVEDSDSAVPPRPGELQ